MAAVERKNTHTDEKHSLSSFDKRKVQSVTFGGRQHSKKYKVAKKTNLSNDVKNVAESTSQAENFLENSSTNPYSDHAQSDKSKTFEHTQVKSAEHHKSNQITSDGDRNTITPEISERMKRAAFISQLNNESITQNVSYAKYIDEDDTLPTDENSDESVFISVWENKNNDVHNSDVSEKSSFDDHKSGITPEMAQRMKRAAFLQQKNIEAIQLNTVTVIPDDEPVTESKTEYADEKRDSSAESVQKEKIFESRFTGNSGHADFEKYDEVRHDYAVTKAYGRYKDDVRRNRQENEKANRDVLAEISETAAVTGELAKGQVGKVTADIIVKNALSDNGFADSARSIGNAVKGSSSVSSAVPDVAATLAAVEAKKTVAKLLKGESSEKDKAFVEEHKAKGRTKYVDSDKERHKVEYTLSENEFDSENMSREERRNFLHNKRVEEKQRSFYADRLQTEKKNKQKEMFLEFNKDNPELVSNSGNVSGKRYVKKKVSKALIGGGAASALMPIIIVIIIFAVIAAFFGWLTPFSYTLAGDEGEEDERTYEAETNAEVIDGYAKMIKNYMDVTQAYFYLNYGDWYGGTYEYPAPDLSFSDFFSNYCQQIINEIQAQYSSLMANASSAEERSALGQMMGNAISAALNQALPQALAEYNQLMAELDDSLTAQSHRQHYEVSRSGGANGQADSAEFSGMPIVGTNNFGNVEINSSLSAEELLAYIALYKSMSIINPDESDPDAEQILNITSQDIMDFFDETEYIKITAEVTHSNYCGGMNCKRRLIENANGDYEWEYYCEGDHDNLTGAIGACLTADELRAKVMEITDAEENGVDEDSFKKLIEEYMKLIKKELDIDESDFRQFGAADNVKAQEFYRKLISDGEIPNNFWEVNTPIGGEDSDE